MFEEHLSSWENGRREEEEYFKEQIGKAEWRKHLLGDSAALFV